MQQSSLEACFSILQAATLLPGGKHELEASDIHKVYVTLLAVTLHSRLTSSAKYHMVCAYHDICFLVLLRIP